MAIYKCRDCGGVMADSDASGHVCPKKFEKVEDPKKVCEKRGHRFKFSYWTDTSGPGEQVETWENDSGHHEAYHHRQMEHKVCEICGHTEDCCVGQDPNPYWAEHGRDRDDPTKFRK